MRGVILVLGLVMVGGCGDGSGSSGNGAPIASGPLAGKIGGQAWTLATAESDSFLSSTDRLSVTMYPTAFTACEAFAAPTDANELIVSLPRTPGSYNLSLDLNVTFYDASTSNNRVATSGRLVIDSVTATTISGGASITLDANNSVNGQFSAAICP